jgi:hypothetical protein
MGLIDDILHHITDLYRQQASPEVTLRAIDWLETRLGQETLDEALRAYVAEFPPLVVRNARSSLLRLPTR